MSEYELYPPRVVPKFEISPPMQGPARFSWDLRPPHRRSPAWYLAWPTPTFRASWFCIPAHVEEATEFRTRRVYAAYCGAPPGERCHCGAQRGGHDPGDEQP